MINWEIVSNDYIDGNRVSVVRENHTLAADTRKLGELQIDLSYRLERQANGENNENLNAEMNDLRELISRYQGFVDGYNAADGE